MNWNPLDIGQETPINVMQPAPEDTPIVVVDDEPTVRRLVGKLLRREGYPVEEHASAADALERVRQTEVSLLIADIRMPEMTGIELSRRALEEDPHLDIIIMTGAADAETAVESLRLGIRDYLVKPIDPEGLLDSVRRTLRRRAHTAYRRKLEGWLRSEVGRRTEEVRRQATELERVTVSTLSALVRAMEARDSHLKGHSERVADLAEEIARRLELPADQIETVRTAGLLHDIGMIAVPESVLAQEGALTPDEYALIQRHAETGAKILQPLTHLGAAVDFVRYHHERLNGSGYPEGLRGDEIPLGAQIVGVAESYAAITEDRPFRPACSPVEALETLGGSAGVWYVPRVLQALQEVVGSEVGAAVGA